jgi:hypothetical protein
VYIQPSVDMICVLSAVIMIYPYVCQQAICWTVVLYHGLGIMSRWECVCVYAYRRG